MANATTKIGKRLVESLRTAETERFIWDSVVTGFGVRRSASGRLSYVVQYRCNGRQRRYKIGNHGSPWAPESARQEARRLVGLIAQGIDPQEVKQQERAEISVGELCDVYLEEGLFGRKSTSVAAARSCIEHHIKPLLGSERAAQLKRSDVEAMLRDVAAGKTARLQNQTAGKAARVRGGQGAANRTFTTPSAALSFGISRGLRTDNPATGVRKFPEKKLERFLCPAELARLGQVLSAAEALGVENRFSLTAIRLLMLTGCRKNEIITLKRSHIDFHHKCLRLPDSKTGAKVVHMGAAALRVIAGTPEVAGNDYLLPGKSAGSHVGNLQSCWNRIRQTANLRV